MRRLLSHNQGLGRLACALLLCWAGPAQAQVRLPGLNLPQPLGGLDSLVRPAERLLERSVPADLRTLRANAVETLLQRHRKELEADPRGEPVVRQEILATSPAAAALQAAARLGFEVVREDRFDELGETLVVLRAPQNLGTQEALARLRALDPAGSYDFNHIYTGSSALPPSPCPPPHRRRHNSSAEVAASAAQSAA